MRQFSHTITDPCGLHARVAGPLVRCAQGFFCDVTLTAGGRKADGKSIMSVLWLGAPQGCELTITTEGSDEEQAARALQDLCARQL